MRTLVTLLTISFFAGACTLLSATKTVLAADDGLSRAAVQSREVENLQNAEMDMTALDLVINTDRTGASLDLNAWSLENQNLPLYENNAFRFGTFRFRHEQKDLRAAVGDVSVQSSELIAPSLSRRGALLGVQKTGYSAEAFTVHNTPVNTVGYELGQSNGSQILFGGRITRTVLEDRGLRFTFHYLDGRNADPFVSDTDPQTAHQKGAAYSTVIEGSIAGGLLGFSGEYCYSRYDGGAEDNTETLSDRAWKVKLFGSAQRFSYALGYKLLGENFRTVANPLAANNRDELFANTEYLMDSSSVSFSLHQSRNNREGTELAPLTVSRTGRIGYKYILTCGPVLFLNQSLNTRRSVDEPAGYAADLDSTAHTTHFGISYAKEAFDLTPSYSITRFIDRTSTVGGSSLTHTARLACGIRPHQWISLNPVFIYRNYLLEESDIRIRTYQGSLNSIVQVIPRTLTVAAMVSYLEKKADDDSTGFTEKKAQYQLSWNIEKYLRKMGSKSLAFMGEFMHTEDHAEKLTTRNYTLSLMASIGLPFDLLEYQSRSSRFPGNSGEMIF